MSLNISVAPTVEPVSVSEAALHLRVDSDEENSLIASYIKAAREYCENFQNRAYINRTYEYYLDAFPVSDSISIPVNPLSTVTSIKYYDTDDTEATFDAANYLAEVDNNESKISLKYGKTWPSTTLRPHRGVLITFVAGYGDDASSVPEKVKLAILLLIGDYYSNREAGEASKETLTAVERLLWQDRVL